MWDEFKVYATQHLTCVSGCGREGGWWKLTKMLVWITALELYNSAVLHHFILLGPFNALHLADDGGRVSSRNSHFLANADFSFKLITAGQTIIIWIVKRA